MLWQQWVNVLLGLGIIAVPFLDLAEGTVVWTLVLAGLAVAALGIWGGLYEQTESHREAMKRAHQN